MMILSKNSEDWEMNHMTWNQETKDQWVSVMQEHQDADRLRAGLWWNGKQGCFFGCAMQTECDSLDKATEAMNLPAWLIYLAEGVFEGLKRGSEAQLTFPVRLLKAIPVNTDIEHVLHEIAVKRLQPLAEANPSVAEEIDAIIALHQNWRVATSEQWEVARAAVEAASWSARAAAEAAAIREGAAVEAAEAAAAWSASRSAAWSASRSAARSAAEAARAAAEAAAWSAWSARAAVEAASWQREADNLIEALTKGGE